MPDIQLRFHRDMLVLSGPIDPTLKRQGFDPENERQFLNLMEADSVRDATRLQQMAGAVCLVANTQDITAARLAHARMEGDAAVLAHNACEAVRELHPQHLLVEIGPCGLPLDASSKASLNENRAQYAGATRLFANEQIDAFFLNGFTRIADLKCALMGVAQVSSSPVFASVVVGEDGLLANGRDTLADAVAAMEDLGASVVGFETALPEAAAVLYAQQVVAQCPLPLLVQLRVAEHAPKQGEATYANPYFCPDVMEHAAVRLFAAGAQFLRATGEATPAYTGALAATVSGLDVRRAEQTDE